MINWFNGRRKNYNGSEKEEKKKVEITIAIERNCGIGRLPKELL